MQYKEIYKEKNALRNNGTYTLGKSVYAKPVARMGIIGNNQDIIGNN